MENNQPTKLYTIVADICFVILSVIFLIYPALYNGYPLLYTDSATYVISGHELNIPIDRPVFYGLFVWISSFSYSLWLVVIIQALFVVGLVYYTYSLFFQSFHKTLYAFFTIVTMSLFTGLPNYVSQIMPDIFTGILVWLVILFFFSKSAVSKGVILAGILLSTIVHNSNMMTLSLMIGLILLTSLIFKKAKIVKSGLILGAWSVFIWLLVPTLNYSIEKEWYVSKSGSIFLIGKMIQTGVVKDYLEEECPNNNYELCRFKDSLPQYSYEFYWNANSPLYYGNCGDTGGWSNCWKVKSAEYKKIIFGVLKKPDLLYRYTVISVKDAFRQIFYFDMIHFIPLGGEGSAFDSILGKYFKDFPMFKRSIQYSQQISYEARNLIQRVFIAITAVLSLVFLFVKLFKAETKYKMMALWLLAGFAINAALCSTFSIVEGRFQGRLVWLVPLFFGLLLANYLENRKMRNE